jgi:glucose-6-phosphate isomerase
VDEAADHAGDPNDRRWLTGLRRAWIVSGALESWIEHRGVTGTIWTPASYDIDDLAEPVARLTSAGARPDAALLWDMAIDDVRAAADLLRGVHSSSDGTDGYVVVWLDPSRASDPEKALAAAADLAGDIRKSNIAVGLAWTSARTAVVQALIGSGMPIALSAVRDTGTFGSVISARTAGMDRRRSKASEDERDDLLEVPLFVLSPPESTQDKDAVYGVRLTSELELFGTRTPTARVPLSPDAEQSGASAAAQRLTELTGQKLTDDEFSPEHFARVVASECAELDEDEVLEDIWARDHEVWKDDPTEIADRLGWLDVAERMHGELKDLTEFARKARAGDAVKHVVLCGMGGSVLAGETFRSSFIGGGIPLTVLDTTHPDHIETVRSSLDLQHTLFVIGSKSGTTIETRAHLEYFWSLVSRGDRFVAVTDPGSELASVAKERGFLRVFENPPDIGGRYSALSYFGLVPAALCGVDIEPIVAGARRAMARNSPGVRVGDAPAARLGAAMFEAHRDACDKLTLVLPKQLHSLGGWIEQLIAESTGKEGTGLVPVVGEELGPPVVYGDDRVFCVYTLGDEAAPPGIEALEADHPVIRIRMRDVKALGAEMFRWEMATAILGYSFDINPFDQPDVEAAKLRAREALTASGQSSPEKGSASTLLPAP